MYSRTHAHTACALGLYVYVAGCPLDNISLWFLTNLNSCMLQDRNLTDVLKHDILLEHSYCKLRARLSIG